mmetsp:Transcript_14219/g.29640  ORF Transcript_14219/g.29640 Transcript_14219/m.29640 type:complete len:267 (+) Transcript_14219:579-1379(+)
MVRDLVGVSRRGCRRRIFHLLCVPRQVPTKDPERMVAPALVDLSSQTRQGKLFHGSGVPDPQAGVGIGRYHARDARSFARRIEDRKGRWQCREIRRQAFLCQPVSCAVSSVVRNGRTVGYSARRSVFVSFGELSPGGDTPRIFFESFRSERLVAECPPPHGKRHPPKQVRRRSICGHQSKGSRTIPLEGRPVGVARETTRRIDHRHRPAVQTPETPALAVLSPHQRQRRNVFPDGDGTPRRFALYQGWLRHPEGALQGRGILSRGR